MSAKRMTREVIFVEDYDTNIGHEIDEQSEDLQRDEEDTSEQLRIGDEQEMVESEEEIQIETDQEDELAEEDDTSKPMMTRRGSEIPVNDHDWNCTSNCVKY